MPPHAPRHLALIEPDVLNGARLRLVSRLEQRKDEILDVLLDTFRAEIFAFAAIDDAEMLLELKQSARVGVVSALRALAGEDGPPLEPPLTVHHQLGRQRAAQGFPLHALIASFQITARVLSEFAIDELARMQLDSAVVASLGPGVCVQLLAFATRVTGTVTEAYRQADQDLTVTEQRLRREVFDELLNGPRADAMTVQARARAVGCRLGTNHTVAIVTLEGLGGLELQAAESLRRRISEAIQKAFKGLPQIMIQTRDTAEVAILPLEETTSGAAVLAALERALSSALGSSTPWFAALGRVERGVAGIAASYRQALRAHEAARSLGLGDRVVPYEATLPVLLLLQDAALTDDVYRATVAPLMRYDEERDAQLVETLEALFEEQGNTLAAAKALFVHRHMLTARLKRIEQLTGRSLRDRGDLQLFELGLMARHVLPSRRRR